jgi:hypothetical protein
MNISLSVFKSGLILNNLRGEIPDDLFEVITEVSHYFSVLKVEVRSSSYSRLIHYRCEFNKRNVQFVIIYEQRAGRGSGGMRVLLKLNKMPGKYLTLITTENVQEVINEANNELANYITRYLGFLIHD